MPSWDIGKTAEGTAQAVERAGRFSLRHPAILGALGVALGLAALSLAAGLLGVLGGLMCAISGGIIGAVAASRPFLAHLRGIQPPPAVSVGKHAPAADSKEPEWVDY